MFLVQEVGRHPAPPDRKQLLMRPSAGHVLRHACTNPFISFLFFYFCIGCPPLSYPLP
jgi:hypothetical protein